MNAVQAESMHRTPSLAVQGLLLAVRLGLAAVFLWAAIPKILDPLGFAGNVLNYEMLPPWGVNAMALVLPWLELVIGICLALGMWTRAAAIITACLMLVFMVAFASAKARGLNIDCGCFEVGADGSHGPSVLSVVARDIAFLVAALILARWPDAPSPLDLLRRRRA